MHLEKGGECKVENDVEKYIESLFRESEKLYSLLWWESKDSSVINANSFVINGKDSIPIFATVEEARQQLKGSGFEKNLVGVKPELLADVLQKMEWAILNPGSSKPISFRTCIVKKFGMKKA